MLFSICPKLVRDSKKRPAIADAASNLLNQLTTLAPSQGQVKPSKPTMTKAEPEDLPTSLASIGGDFNVYAFDNVTYTSPFVIAHNDKALLFVHKSVGRLELLKGKHK